MSKNRSTRDDSKLDESELHQKIVTEFYDVEWNQRDERRQSLEDRRFYSIAGAQYEGRLGELFENKPQIEINKTHLSVIRIINEYRNNRITVDYVSKDGTDRTDLADFCDGLYRADEQDSVADEAYDNSFEEGVGGGMGAFRYRSVQEDEFDDENEYQRIAIEPIFDADQCVFFDLDAKRYDKADADRCWVLIPMTRPRFRDEFGKDPVSFPRNDNEDYFDWHPDDTVYICEHYRVEHKKENLYIYEDLEGNEETYSESDFDTDESLEEILLATGSQLVRERSVKKRRIHKYLVDGAEILEDCGLIAGPNIPITPFYGKRWVVQNIERWMGHVRLQKDAQRLGNIERSQLATISAMSPTEKPIFLEEQMQGNEQRWADDNVLNLPYQVINGIEDSEGNLNPMGPVGSVKPPSIPPALAALIQISDQDQRDLSGNQEQGEQIRSNISSEAYSMIQTSLGMQTFIYMSNFAKTMKRGGEIWLGMKRETAVEQGRLMKTIDRQGNTRQAELMRKVQGPNGEVITENDLREAKFELVSEVGPSSSSKKQATIKGISEILPFATDPADQRALTATAIMNMEGEGLDSLGEYFRKKLVEMGVEKPNEEEEAAMEAAAANQQPDPNTEFLLSEAEKNKAQARKLEADTNLSRAKTMETEADTIETYAGIDRDDQETAVKTMQALKQAVSANPS